MGNRSTVAVGVTFTRLGGNARCDHSTSFGRTALARSLVLPCRDVSRRCTVWTVVLLVATFHVLMGTGTVPGVIALPVPVFCDALEFDTCNL